MRAVMATTPTSLLSHQDPRVCSIPPPRTPGWGQGDKGKGSHPRGRPQTCTAVPFLTLSSRKHIPFTLPENLVGRDGEPHSRPQASKHSEHLHSRWEPVTYWMPRVREPWTPSGQPIPAPGGSQEHRRLAANGGQGIIKPNGESCSQSHWLPGGGDPGTKS